MARRSVEPQKYNESNIQRVKGLDGVRKRPGMYLGERGDAMVFQSIKELIDNGYDEFSAGRNKFIYVQADNKTNTFIVADKAQGIPIGLVPSDPENPRSKKVSTLTLIFTELHTGGKFDDKAYKTSKGTHGVGAAATNAVSSVFEVWTHRDRAWHYQQFKCGKPVSALTKITKLPLALTKSLSYKPVCGSIIRIVPDQSIVSKDGGKTKAKLNLQFTADWLKALAQLNPGLEITFSANGKQKTFLNSNGLKQILIDRLKELDAEGSGKPIIYESATMSVAIQWSTYSDDDALRTYVESGYTRDGGEHEVGFRNALAKVIRPFAKKTDKYAPKDLYYGLIGVLNYRMSGAEYSGQTKDRLTSNVAPDIEKELVPVLTAFFNKNKSTARSVIRRAMDVKKSKDEFKRTLDAVANAKKKSKNLLPASLIASPKATALTRELFIVEGDSAGGCHFSDVSVLLADGSTKTFEQLVEDEAKGIQNQGIAFDLATGKPEVFTMVEPRIIKEVTEYIELELADGTIWRGTTDHPWLLTDGTYKAACDLMPDDDVQEIPHLPSLLAS